MFASFLAKYNQTKMNNNNEDCVHRIEILQTNKQSNVNIDTHTHTHTHTHTETNKRGRCSFGVFSF